MTKNNTWLFIKILSGIFTILIGFAIVFAVSSWSILRDTVSIPSEAVFDLTVSAVFFFFAGILLFLGLFALILIPNKTKKPQLPPQKKTQKESLKEPLE